MAPEADPMTDPSDTAHADGDPTAHGSRPDGTGSSGRQTAAVLVAAAAVAGLLSWTARQPASGDETEPPPVEALRAEVEAMVDSGLPEDHPKVQMLTEDADELAEQWGDEGVPEQGVDLEREAARGELASSPDEAERQSAEVGTDLPPAVTPVDCEPIPQRLSAEAVAGARCMTVPQPDGSSLYVALAPNGRVRSVAFAPGGEVTRMADTTLPPGATASSAELAPGQRAGDLTVRRRGTALGTMTITEGG
jgi:hypothetical protein